VSRFRIDWERKDERLKKMYAAGQGPKLIAPVLGVSPGAVKARIAKLGLKRND
jgi:uncharacterized protein YjcR